MHIQYRPSVLSGTWGSKQFIRMHNSRLLVLVNRIARNRRENIFSYHLYFSQCFAWYLKKSVYQGIYLFLNYLILDMYIKPSTFRFWCFIFDKMVGSICFLWSSTFTWSNSVRLDIRWDEGWRDEMRWLLHMHTNWTKFEYDPCFRNHNFPWIQRQLENKRRGPMAGLSLVQL